MSKYGLVVSSILQSFSRPIASARDCIMLPLDRTYYEVILKIIIREKATEQ